MSLKKLLCATLFGVIAVSSFSIQAGPILNSPPSAITGGAYSIDLGDNLSLNGSFTDPDIPDGDIVTGAWDLNNDGQFDDAGGFTPVITWAYLNALLGGAQEGNYQIGLRVTDSFGDSGQQYTTLTIGTVGVPAPAAVTLVIFGLAGIGFIRRKANI